MSIDVFPIGHNIGFKCHYKCRDTREAVNDFLSEVLSKFSWNPLDN